MQVIFTLQYFQNKNLKIKIQEKSGDEMKCHGSFLYEKIREEIISERSMEKTIQISVVQRDFG